MTSDCVTKMWAIQGKKNYNFTDFVYIENVDEGVLTLSAFSCKMSVKRPFFHLSIPFVIQAFDGKVISSLGLS